MSPIWPFRRKDKVQTNQEDPGPLLPGAKSIGESQTDAEAYLAKALSPGGRLKGVLHPETSRRDIKLGPVNQEPPSALKDKASGPQTDAALRERMLLILSEASGKPTKEGVQSAAQSEEGYRTAVNALIAGIDAGTAYQEFNAAFSRSLRAQLDLMPLDSPLRRGIFVEANLIRRKVQERGQR